MAGHFFSARYRSAYSLAVAGGRRDEVTDVRAAAGLSPVGDWAGANADTPEPRRTRPAGS